MLLLKRDKQEVFLLCVLLCSQSWIYRSSRDSRHESSKPAAWVVTGCLESCAAAQQTHCAKCVMQIILFTIYTICRMSPLLTLLYIWTCLLYLLFCLSTLFFSQSVNLSHCCLSIFLSASIFNSLRYHRYSSSLRHPGKLNFVFNIVEFPACSGRPAGRRGLCTGGLFDLISPMLVLPGNVESSSKTAVPKVMSTVERAAESGLCSLTSWPMLFLVCRCYSPNFQV